MRVYRPLPGVELWSGLQSPTSSAFIMSGYQFGRPVEALQGRVYRKGKLRGSVVEATGVELITLEPGDVGSVLEDRGPIPHITSFRVDPTMVERYLDPDARHSPRLASHETRHPEVLDAHRRMVRAIERRDVEPMEREHLLRAFLGRVFADGDDRPSRRTPRACERAARTAAAIIHDRFTEALSLSDLATVAGISVFHLERSFVRVVGVPVHRYLQLIRLNRALDLMRAGVAPADAAVQSGFSDQAHLTRTFRKRIGGTPGRYVRSTA